MVINKVNDLMKSVYIFSLFFVNLDDNLMASMPG